MESIIDLATQISTHVASLLDVDTLKASNWQLRSLRMLHLIQLRQWHPGINLATQISTHVASTGFGITAKQSVLATQISTHVASYESCLTNFTISLATQISTHVASVSNIDIIFRSKPGNSDLYACCIPFTVLEFPPFAAGNSDLYACCIGLVLFNNLCIVLATQISTHVASAKMHKF